MKDLTVVLLCAGKGGRLKSTRPKALHMLCGRTSLDWILQALKNTPMLEKPVAVVHHGAEQIIHHYGDTLVYARQTAPLGTGGALIAALDQIQTERVLVVAADLPLITRETLLALMQTDAPAAFLTATLDDPRGYGRVIRENGRLTGIAPMDSAARAHVREVRVSAYSFLTAPLQQALSALQKENPLGEISMGDVVTQLYEGGVPIEALPIAPEEALGFNDRMDLARCMKALRHRINRRHMQEGVTMIDPDACYIDDTVKLRQDCMLYPGVVLEGNTVIGEDTVLYPACRLKDTRIGKRCALQGVVANAAVVGDDVTMGPYVNLRPGANIGNGCKVGNYIEVKNAFVDEYTKLPHLSYIGDADLGKRVNVGCGSVTVNYDGFKKHRTVVEDDVFIGCHTSLVAPVRVKKGAFTAAGSVITDDVPEETLAIARSKQVNKIGYTVRLKKKRES